LDQRRQSVTRTFTVNNSGSAVLTLQTPQLPFGFSLTEPLSSQLAPGANDTFTVSFSPQGAGTYSGEISIGNNDSDENPYNFAIQGSVSAPEIGVSGGGVAIDDGDWTPSTADGTNFGMISSGQSVTRTFTVQNSGSATLTLQAPQLPAGFVLTESLATQLAPGTSDTFSVQFSPVNPGTYSGEISIGNNDSNENPYNFAITGTMGGPEINVLGNGYVIVDGDTVPSAVDGTYFGTVGPAQTVDHTFIVNNTGTALLSLSLRALPAGFLLTEPLTSVLAAGGTDSFTVRFAPDIVGQYGGEIIIDNNDADEAPYNFAVFGIRGTPEMDVRGKGVSIADGDNTPSAADDTYFGMAPPNIVASRTFTVRNDGTTTLYLGQVSLGPGSGFRIGSDTLLSQIGPGQSDTFSVELVSATPGTFVRTVTIYNSDSDECPYDFVIRGIVGVPEIDLTGKGVSIADGDTTPSTADDTDFGSVLVSTATTTNTLTKTFTVRNTGSGTLYLGTPSVTGTGFWRGAKVLRTWLEPGESDTFDVKFASTTTGTFTGEVILYNSDANEAPYNFALTAIAGTPEIDVIGNGLTIANGDVATSTEDGTNFGTVYLTKTSTHTYTVRNDGTTTLYLGAPSISGTGFSLGADRLVQWLAPGIEDTFSVTFISDNEGDFSGIVTIYNSDEDESPYVYGITAHAVFRNFNVNIKVAAFIPLSFGDAASWDEPPGEPYQSLRWSEQPLNWSPGSVKWFFSTDNRETAGSASSSRLFSTGSINTSAIGDFEELANVFSTDTGVTHRVSTIQTYELKAYKNTIETGKADPSFEETRADGPTGKSMVAIAAGASYPFVYIAPEINYDVAFTFEKVEKNGTKINFGGWHDAFPAFEIIINGEVVHCFYSPDEGPTPWNLGGFWTVPFSGSLTIYPPEE
jgi:hypothetical protein